MEEKEAKVLTEYREGKLKFILEIKKEDFEQIKERHIVHIYKGPVFHLRLTERQKQLDSIPIVKTTRKGIYLLAIKKYQENKELFQTKREDILEWIDQYVVDTAKYQNFNLIEPLEQEDRND